MHRAALYLSVLIMAGCAIGPGSYRWRRLPVTERRPLASDQSIEVWSHGGALYWKKVIITTDSISGVRYPERDCPKPCQRSGLPLSDVDSIRYSNGLKAGPLAGVMVATLALIALASDPYWMR
jgi:hypothetical protein